MPLVRLRCRLVAAIPLLLSACHSQPPEWPPPHVGESTTFSFSPGFPPRALDLLFVIDNSPSMANKQAALAANFVKMIEALQRLSDGLPDMHIGVVSGDMGAGTEVSDGSGRWLGDRGLLWGNDPSPGAVATAGGAGCGLKPGARWIVDTLKFDGSGRDQNYVGELTEVFTCLARAVGTSGSPYPQPLQALRVALNPQRDVNEANTGFLRTNATLYIVLISDQDDCSADPDATKNDGLFLQVNPGDSPRLRCAARGHVCNGQPIPDYTPLTGYSGPGFTANLADCAAKDQVDPAQPDYSYLPLIRVQDIVDSINNAIPSGRILVSGIIGWPADRALTSPQYQIGKDPTAPSPQDSLWDVLPVCTTSATALPATDGYKAYPALRLKEFLDATESRDAQGNPLPNAFSICNPDFSDAIVQIGDVGDYVHPGCVQYPLVDSDPNTPVIEPQCQAIQRLLCDPPGLADCPASGQKEEPLPQCKNDPGHSLDPANPLLDSVPEANRPCWYLVYDIDPGVGCPDAYRGQRISVLRQAGHVAPPYSRLVLTCWTCSQEDPLCSGFNQ